VDWEAAKEIRLAIFVNTPHPNFEHDKFFTTIESSLSPSFSGRFHLELYLAFPEAIEWIQGELWHICKQFKPEEGDFHKLFNILIFAFDQLLSVANKKVDVVPLAVQSGSRNHSS